jgi:hypothetical protein
MLSIDAILFVVRRYFDNSMQAGAKVNAFRIWKQISAIVSGNLSERKTGLANKANRPRIDAEPLADNLK